MVIAIIGLLAALVLPALNQAREKGRRVVCLNNLRQVTFGAAAYAGDYDDMPPTTGACNYTRPLVFCGATNTQYVTWGNSASGMQVCIPNHPGGHTGWWLLVEDLKYFPRTLARCPSMRSYAWVKPGNFNGGYMSDYDYRWNNFDFDRRPWQCDYVWHCRGYFGRYPNQALFWEASGYRREPWTGEVYAQTVDGQWAFQWPHRIGGHVALGSGAAFWLQNVDFDGPWNYVAGWPSGGVSTEPSYYGYGLDLWVKQAGY